MCGLIQNEHYHSGASQTYLSNPNSIDFSSRFADQVNNGLLNNFVVGVGVGVGAGNFSQSLASSLNINMGANPTTMSTPFSGLFTEGFNVEANPTMGTKYHTNLDSCMEVAGYGWY